MLDEIRAKRDEIYAIARKHKAEKLWVFGSCARKEERPYITLDSVSLVYIPPVEEALRYMDSLMSFKPSLITCDTVDVFKPIVATPPMLTKDSIEAISKRAEEAARKALEEKEKAAKAAKKAKKKSKK